MFLRDYDYNLERPYSNTCSTGTVPSLSTVHCTREQVLEGFPMTVKCVLQTVDGRVRMCVNNKHYKNKNSPSNLQAVHTGIQYRMRAHTHIHNLT